MELPQFDKPIVSSLLEDDAANTAGDGCRWDDSGFDLDESLYALQSESDQVE